MESTQTTQQSTDIIVQDSGHLVLADDSASTTFISTNIFCNKNVTYAEDIKSFSFDCNYNTYPIKSDNMFTVALNPRPTTSTRLRKIFIHGAYVVFYFMDSCSRWTQYLGGDMIIEYVSAGKCVHHVYKGRPVKITSIKSDGFEYKIKYD